MEDRERRDLERHLTTMNATTMAAWYGRQDDAAEARARALQQHALSLRADERAERNEWENRLLRQEQREIQAINEARQQRAEARAEEAQAMQRASFHMHQEAHDLQMRRMQEEMANEKAAHELAEKRFRDPRTSGLLGKSRFATIDDARRLGMCDSSGLFLGILQGKGIYYNGDRHLTTFAGTRTGKGRNLILQALARYTQRSVIITDVKDGENAFSSAHHRCLNLKNRVITLNPMGLHGFPSARLNPLDPVIQAPDREKFDKAGSISSVLSPVVNKESQNAWVNEGASLILQCVIAHLAKVTPTRCTLGQLWSFFTTDTDTIRTQLKELEQSPLPAVAGYARKISGWTKAVAQWEAYSAAIGNALAGFTPDSPYTLATDASDIDARDITKSPHTIYLMMRADDLAEKGMWVSLMVNHLVRSTAASPGPIKTLFLLDEFTQLPPVPRVLEAINLNAGKGQQFWIFGQDRETLEVKYGKAGARQFERQSGVTQAWQMRDLELMRDFEHISGRTSVNMISANMSHGGHIGTGLNLTEQTRQLLQAEDLRMAAEDEQFIIPHQGPIIKARLWPWDKTEGNRLVLRDPRLAQDGEELPPIQPLLTYAPSSAGNDGATA